MRPNEEEGAVRPGGDATARRAPRDGSDGLALRPGIYLGIGAMGAIDEIVFHQLLQWHHFYIHTHLHGQIVSDGLLHVFTLSMLLLGAVLLWERRRLIAAVPGRRPFLAGFFFGLGGFQLFDGIVAHKVLRLHPIREGVDNLLPYDLAWNAVAVLLFVAGWIVWRQYRFADTP